MSDRPKVRIYSDGGCAPNPGPGGWAAILISPAHHRRKEIYGYDPDSTNNRMELTAALMALRALKVPCLVEVTTDSRYLHDAFKHGWLERWHRNGWRTRTRDPVKNVDLWQQLSELCRTHRVSWRWVRGHGSDKDNNRCDELVRTARERRVTRMT